MSAFLDSSFIIAFLNVREANHREAGHLMTAVREGRLGTIFTSEYVYDESTALALRRFGRRAVQDVDALVSDSGLVRFLRVTPEQFEEARERLLQRIDTGLSLTDWTIVLHCEAHRIDTILSFDSGFDGIHPRNRVSG